jgi:protein TonB
MRIVTLVLVGAALIGGAFGLGRVTRASADNPVPPRAVSTPVPLEAGQPVSAAGPSEASSLPALRPAPRPKKAKKPAPTRTTTKTASPAPTAAPTTAPSSPRPSTSAPSNPKPKKPASPPVEEIG